MGGAVALKAHRRFPDLFQGAILQAPMCKASQAAESQGEPELSHVD